MIGGNLTAEFGTVEMPVIIEDPKFPGMNAFPVEFTFRDQFTIVGPAGTTKGATARAAPNYSRDHLRVIMRLDTGKMDLTNPSFARLAPQFRADNDFRSSGPDSTAKGGCFTRPSDMRTTRWTMSASRRCTWARWSGCWGWWMSMSRPGLFRATKRRISDHPAGGERKNPEARRQLASTNLVAGFCCKCVLN